MEDENTSYEKIKREFESVREFSERIGEMAKQLLFHLENTEYKVMDTFRPYIQPKKNISKLLEFYDLYSKATKDANEIMIDLETNGLDLNNENSSPDLKKLSEIQVIAKIEQLQDVLESLHEYGRVKIVDDFRKKTEDYISDVADLIRKAFFSALERLPKVVVGIEEYARFLLRHLDNKSFLSEYTRTVYSRLGFVKTGKLDALLQQTKNLTKYFNMIIDLNSKILGKRVAQNINVGILTMLVINLKNVIGDALSLVDKNNKPHYIPFMIKLYGNLKHTDGKVIRELEEVFVFREQINRLILNCLVQFFCDLELIRKYNPKYKAEKLCEEMAEIIDAFNENKECKRSWVESYGPSLGVHKVKELEENFSEKCLIKVEELSKPIDEYARHIYLINNFCAFKNKITRFKGNELKDLIDKNMKMMIGVWKINLLSLSGSELKRFLESEIPKHHAYFLPEGQRTFLIDKIKEIIEGMVASGSFQGNFRELAFELDQMYSGE